MSQPQMGSEIWSASMKLWLKVRPREVTVGVAADGCTRVQQHPLVRVVVKQPGSDVCGEFGVMVDVDFGGGE